MHIFILGKTKTGKSTIANLIKSKGFVTYEAGSWARQEFASLHPGPTDEFSSQFKEHLTQYALSKLKADPYYSVRQYEAFIKKNPGDNYLIVGVRNPDDFLHMIRGSQKVCVIFIDSDKRFNGTLEVFEEGLDLIDQYLSWRAKLGYAIDTLHIPEADLLTSDTVENFLKGKL